MVLNFLFPEFAGEEATTKDKIIGILSTHPQLTTRKIHHMLKKQYSTDVTYQAVHKLVKQMVGSRVLHEDDHNYSINPDWIRHLKVFTQKLEDNYRNRGKENAVDTEKAINAVKAMKEMDILNLKFTGISELDDFVFRFEEYFIKILAPENEELSAAHRHNRYPAMYPLYKKDLPPEYKQKNISFFIVCDGGTVLDYWAEEFYSSKNMTVVNSANYTLEEDELLVYGDFIVRIYFPAEIRERLDKIFEKVRSLSDYHPELLFRDILSSTAEYMVTIQKNQYVAETIKNKLKKCYLSEDMLSMIEELRETKERDKIPTFDVEYLWETKRQVDYYSNFVMPYLSESEIKLIEGNIAKVMPYDIFKQNFVNMVDISPNIGNKGQKLFTNFYTKYKINYVHITPTKKMKEDSEAYFLKYPEKGISFKFFYSKMKDLPNMELFVSKREPSILFFLDYVYGNYEPDFFKEILRKIAIINDLIVITLQFTPEKLTKDAVKKLQYYYTHRYEGKKFDCGALYEIGFKEDDIGHEIIFNEEMRQIESYSIIKNIPEKLVREVQKIGFSKGDRVLNYISRKPSVSEFENKLKNYFSLKTYTDKETGIGVAFCRLKK